MLNFLMNDPFCDKILSCPIRFEILNLLLSNASLMAHAHTAGPVWFAVTRDVFCNYSFQENNFLYAKSPDPLSLEIEGCWVWLVRLENARWGTFVVLAPPSVYMSLLLSACFFFYWNLSFSGMHKQVLSP